jgi:hypothetical protein
LPDHRAWTIPALTPTMSDLMKAVGRKTSSASVGKVTFGAPDLGPYGEGPIRLLKLPKMEALSFQSDGDLATLVRRARIELHTNRI